MGRGLHQMFADQATQMNVRLFMQSAYFTTVSFCTEPGQVRPPGRKRISPFDLILFDLIWTYIDVQISVNRITQVLNMPVGSISPVDHPD